MKGINNFTNSTVQSKSSSNGSMKSKKGHKRSASSTETILKSFCKNPMTESSLFSASEQNFFRNNQILNGDQTKELLEASKIKELKDDDKKVFIEALDPEIATDDKNIFSHPERASGTQGIVPLKFGKKKRTLSQGSSEIFFSPQSNTSVTHRALGEGHGLETNFSTNRYDLRDEPIFVIPETTNENMNSVEKKPAQPEHVKKLPEAITEFEAFERSPLKSKRMIKNLTNKGKSASSSISSPSQQFSILDLHTKIKGLFDKNIPRNPNKITKEVGPRKNEILSVETALDSHSTVQLKGNTEKFNLVSHIRKISLGNLNPTSVGDSQKKLSSETKSPHSQNTDYIFHLNEKDEGKEDNVAGGGGGGGVKNNFDRKMFMLELDVASLKKKTEGLESINAKLTRKLKDEVKERQAMQEKNKESERKINDMENMIKLLGEEIRQMKTHLSSKDDINKGDFSEHLITTDLSMNESDNIVKKGKFLLIKDGKACFY